MNDVAPVEALLFDFGNVLITADFDKAFAILARYSGKPKAEIAEKFSFDEIFCQHERGEVKDAVFFEALQNTLELDLSIAAWDESWAAILGAEISGARELIRQAAQLAPLYVFTNTNYAHVDRLKVEYAELLQPFTRVFASCELGMRKPEPEAFRHVAAMIGVKPQHILFFDDLAENVAGARAAELQAVQVRSMDDILQALTTCRFASGKTIGPAKPAKESLAKYDAIQHGKI